MTVNLFSGLSPQNLAEGGGGEWVNGPSPIEKSAGDAVEMVGGKGVSC